MCVSVSSLIRITTATMSGLTYNRRIKGAFFLNYNHILDPTGSERMNSKIWFFWFVFLHTRASRVDKSSIFQKHGKFCQILSTSRPISWKFTSCVLRATPTVKLVPKTGCKKNNGATGVFFKPFSCFRKAHTLF